MTSDLTLNFLVAAVNTLTLDVLYHIMPHTPCKFEVKDVHSVQCYVSVHSEGRVCFSISSSVCTKENLNLDVQTRIQPFSVQPLKEGVLEFEIFTTGTMMLTVNPQDPLP